MAPRHIFVEGGEYVEGDQTEPRRLFESMVQMRILVVCFPAAECIGLMKETREDGGKHTEATCSSPPDQVASGAKLPLLSLHGRG